MTRFGAVILACLLAAALIAASIMTGAGHLSLSAIATGSAGGDDLLILVESRLPRTLALILAGTGLAVSGTIMQMISRNRFVEPSTAGTADSAALGMLVAMIVAPGLPVAGKTAIAALAALAGTLVFLRILRAVPLHSPVMVPLFGIMLGGVYSALTAFLAFKFDLMQAIGAWTTGDFSGVLRGRYELLWIALALTIVAYVTAARFTVIGLGREIALNVGLDYARIITLGLVIVSMVTAAVVATVGMVPFLGLVVPNVVSLFAGDNLRRALPLVAGSGAALALLCDIAGRLVIAPYEIPVGTVMGMIGGLFFLYLLVGRRTHVG